MPPTPALIIGDVKGWADAAGIQAVQVPGYWLEKGGNKGREVAPAKPGEKVIYTLHGGAYAICSGHPDDMSAAVVKGLLKYTTTVSRTLSLEYRLSKDPQNTPSNPFPAALIDAIAGYGYLIDVVGFSPEDIIVSGDSAGANLALALTRYLVENQNKGIAGLPAPPEALILNSPWVDLTGSDHREGSAVLVNRGVDFLDVTTAEFLGWIRNFVGSTEGHRKEGAYNRYISPAAQIPEMEHLSFAGFPRTIITAGGHETLHDQVMILKDRMQRDLGDRLAYHEMTEAPHNPLVIPWFEPERSEGLLRVSKWIDE